MQEIIGFYYGKLTLPPESLEADYRSRFLSASPVA